MHTLRWAGLLALVAAGCQGYSPDPVDLREHGRAFAARLPDAFTVRAFAEQLRANDPALRPFDPRDGLDLDEARVVALVWNPGLRLARSRAGVALASAEQAGRWADPELSGSFAYILEQGIVHPWLAGGAIGLSLPITGRPGLERDLANGKHTLALTAARAAEAELLDALDAAWVRWSAALLTVDLLEQLVTQLGDLESIANQLAAAQSITQLEARTFTMARVSHAADLVQARGTVATAAIELRQLLGLPPEAPLELHPALHVQPREADATRRRELLPTSPRLTLLQHDHEVAERQLALAVRKQWPELTLLPGWQEEDAQPRPALGFTLPLPLWHGNAQEIAEARAQRQAAAEALRGALEAATQDLARAEAQATANAEQRRLIETQLVPLAERQIADARRLAELGQLDTLLLLDAVTRVWQAKAAAVHTAVAEATATVALNRLFWPQLTIPHKEP